MDDVRAALREAVGDLVSSGDELERTVRRARHRRRRSRAVAVLLALAMATAGLGVAYRAFSGSPAGQLGTSCAGGWQITQVPNPGNDQNVLASVTSQSVSDAWAVGSSSHVPPTYLNRTPVPGSLGGPPPPTLYIPLVLHWDGTRWTRVPVPNPDVHHLELGDVGGVRLQDVAAASPSDVWAVGGGQGPVIEHWNGSRWSVVPSPYVNLVDQTLDAVAATGPTDAWAVGSGGTGGATAPVIEHWNGRRWSLSPTPDFGNRYTTLSDVAALSPTDAWAVGQAWNEPLALHWDGASWSRVPVPNLRAIRLGSIATVEPDDVWAVGTDYRDVDGRAPAHAVLLHWDGGHWVLVTSPFASDKQSYLGDVSAAGPGDLWARGGVAGRSGDITVQTLLHFDGHSWSVVRGPAKGPATDSWSGVSATVDGSAWLVGSTNHRNGTASAFAGRSCSR